MSQDFDKLKLVELQREDISSLSGLLGILREASRKFILFCDDLSFSYDDHHYKSLKAVLDGWSGGTPAQCRLLRNVEPPSPDAEGHDRE